MDKLSLLLALLLTLLVVASIGSDGHPDPISNNWRPTQLLFYWHDRHLGRSLHNPLNSLPKERSILMGQAQGMYFSAVQNFIALQMVMTSVFYAPYFEGNTQIVMRRNPPQARVHVLTIIDGTERFQSVTSYARISTVLDDPRIGYFIVEYNCSITYPDQLYSSS
ncbi:hypothetical protein KSP40_PGU005798 [Platanthera guangdongensis]|uniref:Dirigent protein n=1 Tax=Platanthera guangdongensis TaxID=2320717 RepID=A0ABR2MG58_9ASPA